MRFVNSLSTCSNNGSEAPIKIATCNGYTNSMIFLQKVTVLLLAVLHLRCVVYGDDHWTMTVEAHPISSRLKSSFLCTSFIRDLRIFGQTRREGCPSSNPVNCKKWRMEYVWKLQFHLLIGWLDVWCDSSFFFHIYFHMISMKLLKTYRPLQRFSSSIPVRFTEGEPLRNHFPTGWGFPPSEVPSTPPQTTKKRQIISPLFWNIPLI